MDNVKSDAGYEVYQQLCRSMKVTAIGELLDAVDMSDCEDFYMKYCHDFMRLAHKCNQEDQNEDKEYELILWALDALVRGEEFCSIDGNFTLLQRIAALHVVYWRNKSELLWFSLLVSLHPKIMQSLKPDSVHHKSEMMLHLLAAKKAIDDLAPEEYESSFAIWIGKVRAVQNVVASIISLPTPPSEAHSLSRKLSLDFTAIQVMCSFMEQVLIKHPFDKCVACLNRLKMYLKSNRNFFKESTLKIILILLANMDKDVKRKRYLAGEELVAFKRHCDNFFLEVVSGLCFGGESAPEPELIEMLMKVVFTENQNNQLVTRQITHLGDQAMIDDEPVIRSSLLQLLLEHNSDVTRKHLKMYFNHSQRALQGKTDQNLCLLCIQCFEDALFKQHSNNSMDSNIQTIINILEDSLCALIAHKEIVTLNISIEYLEGVAGVRYALMEVAALLHLVLRDPKSASTQQLLFKMMQFVKEVCTNEHLNSIDVTGGDDVTGPAIYLLKLVVRQYGFTFLKCLFTEFSWVIPECLQREDNAKSIDPFVIYNNDGYSYCTLREAWNTAYFGRQVDELNECTKDMNIKETAVLLVAMYETITLSYSTTVTPMDVDLNEMFKKFIVKVKAFSPWMEITAKLLLSNGPFSHLPITQNFSAENKTLGAIIVHVTAVLNSSYKRPLLSPFIKMLRKPAELKNAYLPTFQEDYLYEARQALGGKFYDCPNGHPYYVGECTDPTEELNCLTCGARIGGLYHRLRYDNTIARLNDATHTGYFLGRPEVRSVPDPERSLSPPAICIVRAIMHSALYWCSCHEKDHPQDLVQLLTPPVDIQLLPEFFWEHMKKDIEHLSHLTGKSIEDSIILVHLVLREILTNKLPDSDEASKTNSLSSKEERQRWETEFNQRFIQPVLGEVDVQLNAALDLIAKDDKQEHDQLFYLVYERVSVKGESLEPHLWTYRQRISLEHIRQTLQEKRLREKYPILHEFLQMERSLRATQYLPDIVKLQCSLYDTFHHRIDRTTETIGTFVAKLDRDASCYRERIESLKKAYALVHRNLRTHSRLPLDEECCIPCISDDVSLEYLIPTTSGAGALTTSLVDYLVLTHNNFIEKCCSSVAQKSKGEWIEHTIPITHAHRCHLLDYEHQIMSIVLSHCCYSLKLGKAHSVQYDHQALEKHILDKFIHGKPLIIPDIPQVVYQKDVYTIVIFGAIRRKVEPQEILDAQVQRDILLELHTPDRLRDNLDIVNIVLGFLSSGGAKAETAFGEYVDKVLQLERRSFSQKVREHCRLGHIISLWRALSVGLSKLLWLTGEEPFDLLRDSCMKEINGDDQNSINASLREFNLDSLLGGLFEFIETYVKYRSNHELLEWPLGDVLIEDQFEHLGIEKHFVEVLPQTITLNQTVAVWKCIVNYQDKTSLI